MKKIKVVILLLIISVQSIFCGEVSENSSVLNILPVTSIIQDPVVGVYTAKDPYPFEVKAYKKTPHPVLLTLFDAFSKNLDEVVDGGEVNVDSKMGAFLCVPKEDPNNKGSFSLYIENDKNQVIFSYLVTGAEAGTYTLTIDLSAFKGPAIEEKNGDISTWKDGPKRIDSYYQIFEHSVKFPKSPNLDAAKNGLYKKTKYTVTETKKAADATNANITVQWNIAYSGEVDENNKPKTPMGEFWSAEGAISMAICKTGEFGYDSPNNPAGRYQSTVTVTIARS